ncbi:ABC transporter permease [Paraburkholderia hospita]|uniref:ABC transporter permease n=1 Tax=Paraburkholderia hospita TaxID=169430 RepID=UPI0009A87C23|nr:ABC transporter permease [Paraburkholderia hospita]SKD01157.1 ABC-type nitrate/sulfonate/bicarbonate transport system, permease component [Paraburkholderia hospita]
MSTLSVESKRGAWHAIGEYASAAAPRAFRGSIAIVAFIALWEVLPRAGWVDATFLPPFSTVLRALFDMVVSGELGVHLLASAARAATGFAIAVAVGVPLGLFIGWYRTLADVLNPLLELFRNTAPLALLPVFVLVLGMGETSKVSMVIYSCIWPVLLNTVTGVRNVDPLLIRSARSMGLKPVQLFLKVVLPASVPAVFTGIRVAGAYSILVLIAAEMVGAKAGLGYLVNYSQFTFEIPKMYAGIVTLAVLGLAFNQAVVVAERRLTAWRGED